MKFNSILESIGGTPHLRLAKLFPDHEVWVKLEMKNPGASIKDRIALSMIEAAEQTGDVKAGTTIIEATSGNTGIGLAIVSAIKGYRLILVMPDSMSVERRKIMGAYGAELDLTPRELGMKGAIARASVLQSEIENSWIPNQFENPANREAHLRTTAQEILKDFPDGFDYLITGVGTGGHISSVSELLKEHFPSLQTFAVEPAKSPVISGGEPSPHKIQGIGGGFIPVNLHTSTLNGAIQVTEEDAYAWTRRAAKEEGLFVGISSGASLAAVSGKVAETPKGTRILTFAYDTGERYLSIEGLF